MRRLPREIALQLTREDRKELLATAGNLGLSFVPDWPHPEPSAVLLTSPNEAAKLDPDVFFILRADWIIGPFIFNGIDEGYRKGTYSIQPRVNFCCIELYAPRKRLAGKRPRLTSGSLVVRDRPILSGSYVELDAMPEVRQSYDALFDGLSGAFTFLQMGNETVLVSRSNKVALEAGQVRPAFDYQDKFFAPTVS